MEAVRVRDRVQLWQLKSRHPEWTRAQFAEAIGRSVSWVKKWVRRFREQPPDTEPTVLFSRSRAPHNPAHKVTAAVRERILAIRDDPPDHLRRIPGPKAILYYLHRQSDFIEDEVDLPTSTRTIWQVLVEAGRIARPQPTRHQPIERPEPDAVWAMDFKDVSSVPADPDGRGKKQHVVEVLNLVDEGTSRWIEGHVSDAFRMARTLTALFGTLLLKGCPQAIKMDRDPRFIGSWSAQDFPSPLMRALMCVDIDLIVLPPRRPDKNPFVERFHRSLGAEALYIDRPATLEQTTAVVEAYYHHYNTERPNQALSCQNQPPLMAFPDLPAPPPLPNTVDPDAWLDAINKHAFHRRVNANGSVQIGDHRYYIKQALRGQRVTLIVIARLREFRVVHDSRVIKRLSIKGLFNGEVSLSDFMTMMVNEAATYDRRHARRRRR